MSLVFSQILEQLNLSKTATLGTEIGAIVDMFKQESMWIIRPRGQKSVRCREVAVSGGSTVFDKTRMKLFLDFSWFNSSPFD